MDYNDTDNPRYSAHGATFCIHHFDFNTVNIQHTVGDQYIVGQVKMTKNCFYASASAQISLPRLIFELIFKREKNCGHHVLVAASAARSVM